MSLASQIDWLHIAEKPIALFEDHHFALIPWAQWGLGHTQLRLITIDHHCDTHEAFLRRAFINHEVDRQRQASLCAAIDPAVPSTVEAAVIALRHDEHIDAAIRSGILDAAFVIAPQDQRSIRSLEHTAHAELERQLVPAQLAELWQTNPRPLPPMTYRMPTNRMVAVHPVEFMRAGELVNPWPDLALESEHLGDRLAIFNQILRLEGAPELQHAPYILDIDLDAFNTVQSMSPKDPFLFYELIRGALGITVAIEADCFANEWVDEEFWSAEDARLVILEHIRSALSN